MGESRSRATLKTIVCVLCALVLSACGEEGEDEVRDPSTPAVEDPNPPPTTPPPPPPSENAAPVITGNPSLTATVGEVYAFLPLATDEDGDALTFSITGLPQWATFDEESGELSGTPRDGDVGETDDIEITVSDGEATDSIGPFRIMISAPPAPPPPGAPPPPPNTAPTIAGTPPTMVTVGEQYVFQPTASDAEGDRLTFAVANRPRWATFNTSNGTLSGTPSDSDVGTITNVRISVSDGTSSTSLSPFSIEVRGRPNGAPEIEGTPPTSVSVGSNYTFQPTARDPDGDRLTWSIRNRPSWATFSTSTGRLSGRPGNSNVGTFSNIRIRVSDGRRTTSLPAFSITVQAAPNGAPTITGTPPATATVGSAYSFTPTASDPDGDTLSFSIQNKPSWASFSIATGRLSGTPTSAGTHSGIVISVSDGKAPAVSLPAFTLTVNAAPTPANRAPTISGTPATSATVGTAYSFTPTASDPDGDALTFRIQNKPSWATFNEQTGRLSGTPASTGTHSGIVISVTDGKAPAVALPAFTLTVNAAPTPANRAPTISGSPPRNVDVGQAYSFTPNASDPDGDSLVFSIQNRPSWATFSSQTGRLSGTPSASGTFNNIVISVSDGKTSVSLPAFSITVNDVVGTGSATLSWNPPSENTDGSPLTNLAGFRIYYGTSSNALNQTIQIANPGTTTYVVENLTRGTWFFTVRAYTTSGLESGPSNIASKTIP